MNVVRVYLPMIKTPDHYAEHAFQWPLTDLVFDQHISEDDQESHLTLWNDDDPEPVPPGYAAVDLVAAQGLMAERDHAGAGMWVFAVERDGMLHPYKPKVELVKERGLVDINGEQREVRYGSGFVWVWFPQEQVRRYVEMLRVYPRRPMALTDLRLSDTPMPPEVEVIRDLILEQGNARVMPAHVQMNVNMGTGPAHCCLCRHSFSVFTPTIQFTVPPAGAGLFYAYRFRSPEEIEGREPLWARQRLKDNEMKLAVGETGRVHPECIGLTADF